MNRYLATLLNWLDATFRTRSLDYQPFSCSVTQLPDGKYSVVMSNLKVWVYYDQRRYWIAQGLDVGYVAAAPSVEEARQKFMRGLATTVLVNMEKKGSLDSVVKPAPPEVWLQWRRAVRAANPPSPERIVSEDRETVPGLQAPAPKLELAFYGGPA